MIKEIISVPKGIRYVSDWEKLEGGYSLVNHQYPHIVNKQLTGCGFTEYCITNKYNVVICSPRKLLLENKETQHVGEVLYVNNTISTSEIEYDKDIKLNPKTSVDKLNEEIIITDLDRRHSAQTMQNSIKSYISLRAGQRKPYKILVTYDSFRHVKEALIDLGILDTFFVVVDEFQSIFVDSRFKSTTEIEFVSQLRGVQRVCYVSATPMLDKYLDKLDEFKDLPYYEFDWASEDKTRVIRPRLDIKSSKSIITSAGKVIESYRNGEFVKYSTLNSEGNIVEVESKEAVLYFNSVKNICNLIKKYSLTQEECNVLCARTPENIEKVRKAFGVGKKKFIGLGTIPKKGEPHKMFTFCTRTVYLGADFYSTNARSFVFSDANIDCLAVDISLDLPQILGRQRLDENPWKNSAELYFKPYSSRPMTQQEFDRIVEQKVKKTEKLLDLLNVVPDEESREAFIEKLERDIPTNSYKSDYVAINRHDGSFPVPVFNNLVMISEQRAYDIQQVDYKDRFTVFNSLSSASSSSFDVKVDEITEVLATFDKLNTFVSRMRYVVQLSSTLDPDVFSTVLKSIPESFEKYYTTLGADTILKYGCQRCQLEDEYKSVISRQNAKSTVADDIYSRFTIGNRYPSSEVKAILADIYKVRGMLKNAKATDLEEYFITKRCAIPNKVTGKSDRGIEIIDRVVN